MDRQVKKENENPSVGLLLCASKNDEVVEYAMSRTMSPMLEMCIRDRLQRSVYWSEDEFWLRSPYESSYLGSYDYAANCTSTEEQKVKDKYVDETKAIRPATNLNLSNVLFASAVSVKSGKIEEAMTLRLDGKNKGIGTATYNVLKKEIKVNRGDTADTVNLIVQYKSGGQETLYGCPIERSQDVKLPYEDVDLSKCKIWLETTSDGLIYAVEATEENGGTPAEEHTGSHLIDLPQGATWTGINSVSYTHLVPSRHNK